MLTEAINFSTFFPSVQINFDPRLDKAGDFRALIENPDIDFTKSYQWFAADTYYSNGRERLREQWPKFSSNLRALEHPMGHRKDDNRFKILWRSFTETSLNFFLFHQGRGRSIKFAEKLLEQEGYVVPIKGDILDQPGFLWTTFDPLLALSVGLARELVTEEQTYLLGFSIYEDEFRDPRRTLQVMHDHGEWLLFRPENYKFGTTHFLEFIVQNIELEQLTNGVLFRLNPLFFPELKKAILSSANNDHGLLINSTSIFLDDCLEYLSLFDADYFRFTSDGYLTEVNPNLLSTAWSPFLNKLPIPIF